VEQPRGTQARIAQNQARFREANEQIENAADRHGLLLDKKIPFICECADSSCHEIIRMSFTDYEEVRADSRTFINAPGHESAAGAASQVVAERDGYNIVRKRSHAGNVAAALDERRDAGEEAV
jgi:alpha-D-ribose 1-methylphosphonate 5-triphosphate diphosphatase PhnM